MFTSQPLSFETPSGWNRGSTRSTTQKCWTCESLRSSFHFSLRAQQLPRSHEQASGQWQAPPNIHEYRNSYRLQSRTSSLSPTYHIPTRAKRKRYAKLWVCPEGVHSKRQWNKKAGLNWLRSQQRDSSRFSSRIRYLVLDIINTRRKRDELR